MILLNHFPNDNNEIIRNTQLKVYPKCLPMLFFIAKKYYLELQSMPDTDITPNYQNTSARFQKIQNTKAFEQQYLFSIYDLIAAIYRLKEGSGQLSLFNYNSLSKSYQTAWELFFEKQVSELCRSNDFCDHIIELTIFANTDTRKKNLLKKIVAYIAMRYQVYFDHRQYMRNQGTPVVNELPEWIKF